MVQDIRLQVHWMNKSINQKFKKNIIILSIIITIVFLVINIALYIINNNFLVNTVDEENNAFLLITTHLITSTKAQIITTTKTSLLLILVIGYIKQLKYLNGFQNQHLQYIILLIGNYQKSGILVMFHLTSQTNYSIIST